MKVHKGLVGVVVDETTISHVDGDRGDLIYRGHRIEDLVDRPFLEVAHLILFGELPSPPRLQLFSQTIDDYAQFSRADERLLTGAAIAGHPMQALQSLAPLLHEPDSNPLDLTPDGVIGLALCARLPLLVANLQNLRFGMPIRNPEEGLDYTSRFFQVLTGEPCSSANRRLFEVVQILQLEHSFNASTFTARVVASTLAPMSSCLSAALGALQGRLHGGADQATLEMTEEIGSAPEAARYVDAILDRGGRIMGMGHRAYRVFDPRARIIKGLLDEVAMTADVINTMDILRAIEERFSARMAEHGKSVYPNLEFYKGVIYRSLGLVPECFTPCFAMTRCFGWVAHVLESRKHNKIVRPQAKYTGPLPT